MPGEIKIDQIALTREFRKLEKAMADLLKNSRKDIKEILQQQASLFCIDMIHVTQPWGRGTKSKKTGEKAVNRDINKVYLTEYDLYEMIKKESKEQANAFYHFVRKGDFETASKIAGKVNVKFNDFDAGKEHQNKRNNRGRVSKKINKKFALAKDVQGYSKEIQKRVGFAKAGWAQAASVLGNRKVPGWVKRHKGSLGTVKISSRGGVDQVLLINKVSYIGNLVDKYHILKALNSRARAIQKLVVRVIEINANKDAQKVLLAQMTAGL